MPMDIDPLEIAKVKDEAERPARHRWLNPAVGVAVALLATFMGICKVKDDNIVQAMQQAQADRIDHWSFYQARNIRQEIAQATATQLSLAAPSPARDSGIARYKALVADQAAKKDSLRVQAEADRATYDSLNYRDDQFLSLIHI